MFRRREAEQTKDKEPETHIYFKSDYKSYTKSVSKRDRPTLAASQDAGLPRNLGSDFRLMRRPAGRVNMIQSINRLLLPIRLIKSILVSKTQEMRLPNDPYQAKSLDKLLSL